MSWVFEGVVEKGRFESEVVVGWKCRDAAAAAGLYETLVVERKGGLSRRS